MMGGIPFGPVEGLLVLAIACSLLVLVLILSWVQKLELGKEFALGIIMGSSQLFLIALFLTFLFDFEYWYLLIWVLLVTMAVVGGWTSARRARDMPGAVSITTPSTLAGSVTVLVVLAVSGAMPLEPQFIVPLAGMVFGNSMRICSLSLDRLVREVRLNKPVVETTLSLGANSQQAMESYGRMSVRAALIPTIDNLKTLGIIFIPGAMAGLLMGGVDPVVAAEYQIIIFLMIVGGGIISALTVALLARGKVFNEAEQLREWV